MESGLTVGVLRELFRQYLAFKALYESEGIDVVTGPDGHSFSLWDIEYLLEQTKHLSVRQAQSIQLFLIENLRERDVAIRMGVSEENPVASYATHGLRKIITMIESGSLPRFRPTRSDAYGPDALWNPPAAGGRGDSPDKGVLRGGNIDGGEIGHPDPLEGAGPKVAGSVQQGGSTGRSAQTWHVSPGLQSPISTSEFDRGESPRVSLARPPQYCAPKVTRSRRDDSARGDGV